MSINRNEFDSLSSYSAQDLCVLAERLGYKGPFNQLQNNNGSFVSSLMNFFDDNPGAIEAVFEWVSESGFHIDEDDEEEDDEEEDGLE